MQVHKQIFAVITCVGLLAPLHLLAAGLSDKDQQAVDQMVDRAV